MSDVILYKKQAQELAKAVGKAQDALGEVFQTLAKIGITPVGSTEKPSTTANDVEAEAEAAPKKLTKKEKAAQAKAEKSAARAQAKSGNGSAFAEM